MPASMYIPLMSLFSLAFSIASSMLSSPRLSPALPMIMLIGSSFALSCRIPDRESTNTELSFTAIVALPDRAMPISEKMQMAVISETDRAKPVTVASVYLMKSFIMINYDFSKYNADMAKGACLRSIRLVRCRRPVSGTCFILQRYE